MNTNCPQCDAVYAVTEAHIGRKVKCKSCSAALIVTEAGIELQGGAAPPASSFEFDRGAETRGRDDRGDDDDEDRPRRSRKSRSRSRDDRGDADDAGDSGKRRGREPKEPRGPRQPSNLGEYLAFRKMIVPVIIHIVFWIFVGAIVLGALGYLIISLISGITSLILITLASVIVGVPLSILIVRMYCEVLMVFFRMNATLTDIKALLEKQQSPPGSPPP